MSFSKNGILSLYISLLLSTLGLVWFSQQSIKAYWQQTYHQSSPIEYLDRYDWWKAGEKWQNEANNAYHALLNVLMPEEQNEETLNNQGSDVAFMPKTPVFEANTDTTQSAVKSEPILEETAPTSQPNTELTEKQEDTENNSVSPVKTEVIQTTPVIAHQKRPLERGKIVLQKTDKVFFAGDSLMQGVAPFVQKYLKQNFGINSINLSKQSTGLSYPSFFDWPKTIEQTIEKNPDISTLIVFLGPNDPWDIPNPKGGQYLRFKSPEWEQIYKSRVERILTAARTHNVHVIWLGIPYMKAKKLNDQMRYLNKFLADTLQQRVIWLPTENLLSNGKGYYVDSVNVEQKVQRVRSKDGIHFTAKGQKMLADYIQQYLLVK